MRISALDALETPRTLVDQAVDALRDAIFDGTLKPGERVTQDEVAARLGVSRLPVMQALQRLRAEGLLVEAGRRGLRVAPADPGLLASVYEFRAALEPLAVRLATARLGAEGLARGRALVAEGQGAMRAGDARGALEADIAFHGFIAEASGNALVADALARNWRDLRRAMGEVLRAPGLSLVVWSQHAAILEAMARGGAEEAGELMRRHVLDAYARVAAPGAAPSPASRPQHG